MKTQSLALWMVAAVAGMALADGVTVNTSVKLSAGNVSQQQLSGDVPLALQSASPTFTAGALPLTVAWTPIPTGAVAWRGYAWVKNATTNCALSIAVTNGAGVTLFAFLDPGNVGAFPLDTNASYCAAAVPTVWPLGTNGVTTNAAATLIYHVQSR